MVSLRRPGDETLRRFLADQSHRAFTYTHVGASAGAPPSGYVVDRTSVVLGEGEGVFLAAKAAVQRWDPFRTGWIEAWPAGTPIRPGETVAILARTMGLWWVNACRIVHVVEESGPVVRSGFAYGSLPDHAASGEERFVVEWDRSENRVTYRIVAFSRPNHLLARVGYPLMRRTQKRFGRDSAAAMVRAVRSSAGTPVE